MTIKVQLKREVNGVMQQVNPITSEECVILGDGKKLNEVIDFATTAEDFVDETIVIEENLVDRVESMENKIETEFEQQNSQIATGLSNIKTIEQNISNKVDTEVAKVNAQLSEKASKQELAVESARIDNLVKLEDASTTGDAELIDIRIAENGGQYANAGTAIREQINSLNQNLIGKCGNVKEESVVIDIGESSQGIAGGSAGEQINFGSQTYWFRYKIPVVSGEKYKIGTYTTSNPNPIGYFVFTDANGIIKSTYASTHTKGEKLIKEIIAPKSSAFLYINSATDDTSLVSTHLIKSNDLQTQIEELKVANDENFNEVNKELYDYANRREVNVKLVDGDISLGEFNFTATNRLTSNKIIISDSNFENTITTDWSKYSIYLWLYDNENGDNPVAKQWYTQDFSVSKNTYYALVVRNNDYSPMTNEQKEHAKTVTFCRYNDVEFSKTEIQSIKSEMESIKGEMESIKSEGGTNTDSKVDSMLALNKFPHDTFISRQCEFSGTVPPESLVGAKYALNNGYKNIRMSIRKTADNVLVILHDDEINGIARNNDGTELENVVKISETNYNDLLQYDFGIKYGAEFKGGRILKVDDWLAFCRKNGIYTTLEMKITLTGVYQDLCLLISKNGMAGRTVVQSWEHFNLKNMYDILPQVEYAYLSHLDEDYKTNITNFLNYFKGIDITTRLDFYDTDTVTDEMVLYANSKRVKLKVGSARSIKDIIKYMELGIHCIEIGDIVEPALCVLETIG